MKKLHSDPSLRPFDAPDTRMDQVSKTNPGTTTYWAEPQRLHEFVTSIFSTLELPETAASQVADSLVQADLRGVHSHGVTRVPIYVKRLRLGLFNPTPEPSITRTGASTATIDGDNGMGAVMGQLAMTEALDLASETGVGAVGVKSSNHYGIAANYLSNAIQQDMIGFTCSNAPPTMAPWGGRQAMFGTNPLAYAVPAGRHPPIIADMATSVAARGKIILADSRGEQIPDHWALDSEGRPTTDPAAALAGVVLPFGGPKGSALALLVDLLAGVLTGAAFGQELPDFYRELDRPMNAGHFFLAINVGRFMDTVSFKERVDQAIDGLKTCPPAQGHDSVLLPGDIERANTEKYHITGIPLTGEVVDGLLQLGSELGLPKLDIARQPLAHHRPGA